MSCFQSTQVSRVINFFPRLFRKTRLFGQEQHDLPCVHLEVVIISELKSFFSDFIG